MPAFNWAPTSSSDPTNNGVYQDFRMWTTGNSTVFGNIRNPYLTDFTLGLHKTYQSTRESACNFAWTLSPYRIILCFGNVGTDPSSKFFGAVGGSQFLSQINAPRQIELSEKLLFRFGA